MEVSNEAKRILGIAVQILEELPTEYRPVSNIADMRQIIAEGASDEGNSREGYLLVQALCTALAHYALNPLPQPKSPSDTWVRGMNERIEILTEIFDKLSRAGARSAAMQFNEAAMMLKVMRDHE